MAEENTALVADDGALPPEIVEEQAPADDTPEPITNLARDLGWTPKDEWHGEPEKWKPAEQFIRDGREIQHTTARELKTVRDQLERIGNVTETIVRDKVAERDAYWQQRMDQAVDDGDKDTVRELLKARPAAEPAQQGPAPEVSAWVAKNPWYNTDPLAQARAQELSDRLKHLPVPDQLAQVDRAIRKEFPEHFPAPAKAPPATQTGAGRHTGPSNREKGFADMPVASQAVARDMMRRHPDLTLEAFAKSFWADEASKQRRA